jgi:hypothetical protein
MNLNTFCRPVPGYEGDYLISSDGLIFRASDAKTGGHKAGKAHKTKTAPNGYLITILCKNNVIKTHLVHRLVAMAFLPNPDDLPEVNHKNGIKSDTRVENLEWVTRSQNRIHSHLVLGNTGPRGEICGMAKLKADDVMAIRHAKAQGANRSELARRFGVSTVQIGRIVSGSRWGHLPTHQPEVTA